MTLDEVTAKFEARFGRVVQFDENQEDCSRAPNGEKYLTYYGLCDTAEAQVIPHEAYSLTEQGAIDRFAGMTFGSAQQDRKKTLYWRIKPAVENHRGRGWTIRARFLSSAEAIPEG